ncbi:hypothetical protein E2562_032463 [Oryza meyeriana var. granulata]|uniref:Uncharacterized protein n=1 Tax=Oryza meyeriana var. granulata TaxID=110450 RepID=A0A6G1FEI9_9ORYZ|nr:hypothetical protein E2562_032463 [Oryza meyeriana var. granulata]
MSSFPSSASSSTPPSSAPPHRPTSPRPAYRRRLAVTDAIISSLAGDHPSVPHGVFSVFAIVAISAIQRCR